MYIYVIYVCISIFHNPFHYTIWSFYVAPGVIEPDWIHQPEIPSESSYDGSYRLVDSVNINQWQDPQTTDLRPENIRTSSYIYISLYLV